MNRKEEEISLLEDTRAKLQQSIGELDGDSAKIRDILRAEQQALTIAQREKREAIKQHRRIMDEAKGEFERKERELRKKISDLTRGVHIVDKDYDNLKNEFDKITAKASKLEGRNAQVW